MVVPLNILLAADLCYGTWVLLYTNIYIQSCTDIIPYPVAAASKHLQGGVVAGPVCKGSMLHFISISHVMYKLIEPTLYQERHSVVVVVVFVVFSAYIVVSTWWHDKLDRTRHNH